MDRVVIAHDLKSRMIDKFNSIMRLAKHKDTIVYHTGPHCVGAPLRLWALGAYEAGLVILVKEKAEGGYHHCAIRTSSKYRTFVPAAPYL